MRKEGGWHGDQKQNVQACHRKVFKGGLEHLFRESLEKRDRERKKAFTSLSS